MKSWQRVVASFVLLAVFASPGLTWGDKGHKQGYGLGRKLAARDLGPDFVEADKILDEHDAEMQKAILAPDSGPLKLNPKTPSTTHGWEPWLHCGFLGTGSTGGMTLGSVFGERAVSEWLAGRIKEALFDLGCLIHFVEDACFCGHSHCVEPKLLLTTHLQFEAWADVQVGTRSYDDLHRNSWAIEHGGIYLRQGWKDANGIEHWPSDLGGWVDVASHLGYDRLDSIKGLDYSHGTFQAGARYQFVQVQRTVAGVLVEFFKRVGVVPEPTVYFPKERDGRVEIWRTVLGTADAEPTNAVLPAGDLGGLTINGVPIWPSVSPNGKVSLRLEENSTLYVDTGIRKPFRWEFGRDSWPPAPTQIGRAWFLNDYEIALSDASEGNSWTRIVVIQVWNEPDIDFKLPDNPLVSLPLGTLDEYHHNHIEEVRLPSQP
jgi:hypothetical protein